MRRKITKRKIQLILKPVAQKLCAKLAHYKPVHRSVHVPGCGPVSAIRLATPGWRYAIYRAPDGWAIIPENSSDQYFTLVELLMEALLELSQEAA